METRQRKQGKEPVKGASVFGVLTLPFILHEAQHTPDFIFYLSSPKF